MLHPVLEPVFQHTNEEQAVNVGNGSLGATFLDTSDAQVHAGINISQQIPKAQASVTISVVRGIVKRRD
jgi:hypothetical protein